MSGDVQPRKRKDKRRKKDVSSSERSKAEAEFIARKLSVADDSDEGPSIPTKSNVSHAAHAAPVQSDGDSIIHVHHEGGTGGHWCAKIIFFVLLGVLVGLIGLIILENRGLTDLDTPVAESRYAQVFDGWVDEGPAHDDHHDEHTLELKHGDDEHDDDDDDDHDDNDDDIEDIEHEVHDDEDDEHAEESDEVDGQDEDIDNDEGEEDDDDDELHDDPQDSEQDDNDDESGENDNGQNVEDQYNEIDYDGEGDNDDEYLNASPVDNDDDENDDGDDDDDDDDDIDDGDDDYLNASPKKKDLDDGDGDGDGDDDDDDGDDNNDNDDDDDKVDSQENISNINNSYEDEKDQPFEEVDSVEEEVIDNYAGEEEHLAAKRAEQLAQEQDQESTGMGMRLAVGLALMMVAYCVLARKLRNASEDDGEDSSESGDLNRRMTIVSDEDPDVSCVVDIMDQAELEIEEKIMSIQKPVSNLKSEPSQSMFSRPKQIVHRFAESDDDEDVQIIEPVQDIKSFAHVRQSFDDGDFEDEHDGEEEEENDEDVEQISREEVKYIEKKVSNFKDTDEAVTKDLSNEYEDDPYEEELDEEVEDEELLDEEEAGGEEEEEDISEEIDDSDLMKKLEAKYGKLIDKEDDVEGHSDDEKPITPTRKRAKPTGGNALDSDSEDWAGEPDDRWKEQLDLAQAEMDEGRFDEAFRIFTALSLTKPVCPFAKLGRAKALDSLAEIKRSNSILQSAITAYKDILDMKINSDLFRSVANRTVALMRFRGRHLDAVPVHEMLIKKYPSDPYYRNQLAITYLMINKVNQSRNVLTETLRLWPNDGVALVHYGFILKTVDNNLPESIIYMQEGINTRADGTLEGRFLFHLGDALARLGHNDKAREIYEMGASIGVFLSRDQRSLYNINHLTGRPWWKPEETPYSNFIAKLEANWKEIAKEARQLRTQFKPEQENLKDTGDWSQYELFVRGREIKDHCAKCPFTCSLIHLEIGASGCRRGQVKFSAMSPSTHVFAHTGPTNCRLRAHLGLEGTDNTFLRVSQEIRSWEKGKVFIFDDSFEHEVWHNGSALRIVLIVDLWHPELTMKERASLPPI